METKEEKIKVISALKLEAGEKEMFENFYFSIFDLAKTIWNDPGKLGHEIKNSWVDWYDTTGIKWEEGGWALTYRIPWGLLYGTWETTNFVVPIKKLLYALTPLKSPEEKVVLADPNPMNMISYSKGTDMRNFDILITALFFAKPIAKGVVVGVKLVGKTGAAAVDAIIHSEMAVQSRIEATVARVVNLAEKKGMDAATVASLENYTRHILTAKFLPGGAGRARNIARAVRVSVYGLYPDTSLTQALLSVSTGLSRKEAIALLKEAPETIIKRYLPVVKQMGVSEEEFRALLRTHSELRHPMPAVAKVAEATEDAVADARKAASDTAGIGEAVEKEMSPQKRHFEDLKTMRDSVKKQQDFLDPAKLTRKREEAQKLQSSLNKTTQPDEYAKATKNLEELDEAANKMRGLSPEALAQERVGLSEKITELNGQLSKALKEIPKMERIMEKGESVIETVSGASERLHLQRFYEKTALVRQTKEWKDLATQAQSIEMSISELKRAAVNAGGITTEGQLTIDALECALIDARRIQLQFLGIPWARAGTTTWAGSKTLINMLWSIEMAGPKGFNALYKHLAATVPGFIEWFPPLWTWYTLRGMGWGMSYTEGLSADTQARKIVEQTGQLQVLNAKVEETSGDPFNPEYRITFNIGFYYPPLEGKENKEGNTYYVRNGKLIPGTKEVSIEMESFGGEEYIKEMLKDAILSKMMITVDDSSILVEPARKIFIAVETNKAVISQARRDGLGEQATKILQKYANKFSVLYYESFSGSTGVYPRVKWFVEYLNGNDEKRYEKLTPEESEIIKKVISFEKLENAFGAYKKELAAAKKKDLKALEAELGTKIKGTENAPVGRKEEIDEAPVNLEAENAVNKKKDETLELLKKNKDGGEKLLEYAISMYPVKAPDTLNPNVFDQFPGFWNKFSGLNVASPEDKERSHTFFLAYKALPGQKTRLDSLDAEGIQLLTHIINNYSGELKQMNKNLISPFLEFWEKNGDAQRQNVKTRINVAAKAFENWKEGSPIQATPTPNRLNLGKKIGEVDEFLKNAATESINRSQLAVDKVQVKEASEELGKAKQFMKEKKYGMVITEESDIYAIINNRKKEAEALVGRANAELEAAKKLAAFEWKDRWLSVIDKTAKVNTLLGKKEYDGVVALEDKLFKGDQVTIHQRRGKGDTYIVSGATAEQFAILEGLMKKMHDTEGSTELEQLFEYLIGDKKEKFPENFPTTYFLRDDATAEQRDLLEKLKGKAKDIRGDTGVTQLFEYLSGNGTFPDGFSNSLKDSAKEAYEKLHPLITTLKDSAKEAT